MIKEINKPVDDFIGIDPMTDEELDSQFNAQFEDETEENVVDDSDIDGQDDDLDDVEEDVKEDDDFQTEDSKADENKSFLDIDFLGEKKSLSPEEAKMYAQMGMNYPRIMEKMKALEEHPLLKFANQLMTDYGYTDPEEFLSAINAQKEQETFETKVQQYVNQGIGKEMAEKIAKLESDQEQINKRAEEEQKQKETESKKQESYLELFKWHRDTLGEELDISKISDKTLEKISDGMNPKFAFLEQLAEDKFEGIKRDVEQKVLKHKEKVSSAPSATDSDPQSSNEEFSHEYIEQMAEKFGQKWVTKNMAKIEKSGYFNK